MIKKLTTSEILQILEQAPEQCIFDWKSDLSLDRSPEKRCELVKDVVAIANATTTSPGFVFYGVDPRRADPVIGISRPYDDARFQQLVRGKVDPPVSFLYYEVAYGANLVGVVHVPPSVRRPHIIIVDFGTLRDGQIPIRRGSSTGGIRHRDLMECFYGQTSPYFAGVLQKHGMLAADLRARAAFMAELRAQENDIIREMEIIAGLPPGSLGSR